MWAQIIKARLKPGAEAEMQQLMDEIEAASQRSPFVGSTVLQNQDDPAEYYNVVLFESEEAARSNENTPEQQDRVRRIQALYDGPPEFVNCNVVHETVR
ncbi:MAG TPA: antibiotic biosynthesis monooxygenase [Chloroflexota bacterium]|jgi:antibiotic biosynthesis monooxygenase (ABM) superfamily enzyme